jgi:hypothetical protein
MWGLKVSSNKELSNEIFNKIVNSQAYDSNSKKGNDQYFLRDQVYFIIKDISIIHDSYLCKRYLPSEAWPSKREGFYYVGYTDVYKTVNEPCPIECRPINHTDWLYC